MVLSEHPSSDYFRDRWGQWWRVYDGRECPPVEGAPYRYFVGRDGRRYRYRFTANETRQLTPRSLALQREGAEYVPRRR